MKIETDRLIMNVITMADAPDVFTTMNFQHTAEIISFLSWPMTMEQAEKWCRKAEDGAAAGHALMFIARHKETGAPVGCMGLHHINKDGNKSGEVGYWISEDWQRQGMVSEMLQGMIKFAFEEQGLEKLWATTAYENPASDGVLLKGGFKQNGETDVIRPDGSARTSKLFELQRASIPL